MDGTEVFAAAKRNLLAVVPDLDPEAVRGDRALADLGCTSIDCAEMVAMTMEELGIVVLITDFRQATDLDTLVAVLCRHA
jgi:polyketide biosynthesis acyl carrier protein